jgi:hypothetical protein
LATVCAKIALRVGEGGEKGEFRIACGNMLRVGNMNLGRKDPKEASTRTNWAGELKVKIWDNDNKREADKGPKRM